jgi:hypothetical protein
MKQLNNLPKGIEIFTQMLSSIEAEYLIDKIESGIGSENNCKCEWGIPVLHSPDASCLRRNLAINISEHSFQNTECNCGIREIDSMIGKIMLKCLDKYTSKYGIPFTQDEGFIVVKQGDEHVEEFGVDDNPFINRVISMHMPLNINGGQEYIKFQHLDFSITLTGPSVILFPSNFIYSYSKTKNEGLYEIQNYLNNNPTQEFLEAVFNDNKLEDVVQP